MFKNEYFAADYDGIQRSSVYSYIITFVILEYINRNRNFWTIRILIPTYTYVYIQIPFYSSG